MNLLLDTNVLIWWLDDNQKLGKRAKADIANTKNQVFISDLTLLECSIKIKIKKLRVDLSLIDSEIHNGSFTLCKYDVWAAQHFVNLPKLSWADPFDTALIAQSVALHLTLVTADKNILDTKLTGLLTQDAKS